MGGRTGADFALRILIVDSQLTVVSGAMEVGSLRKGIDRSQVDMSVQPVWNYGAKVVAKPNKIWPMCCWL